MRRLWGGDRFNGFIVAQWRYVGYNGLGRGAGAVWREDRLRKGAGSPSNVPGRAAILQRRNVEIERGRKGERGKDCRRRISCDCTRKGKP